MTAQELTGQLRGRWHGRYGTARCPLHDDRRASLSIRAGHSGILVKCFAGCDWRDLRRILGLVRAPAHTGLPSPRPTRMAPFVRLESIANSWGDSNTTTPIPGANPGPLRAGCRHVATYRYLTEDSRLLGAIDRYEQYAPDGTRLKKDLRPRIPAGSGRWQYRLDGRVMPLFNLPGLLERAPSAPIIVCEGEKAAVALIHQGYAATTAPFGARGWKPLHSESLRPKREGFSITSHGDRIILWPDDDAAGQRWLEDVTRGLSGSGLDIRRWYGGAR